jgi:hypothetical protein
MIPRLQHGKPHLTILPVVHTIEDERPGVVVDILKSKLVTFLLDHTNRFLLSTSHKAAIEINTELLSLAVASHDDFVKIAGNVVADASGELELRHREVNLHSSNGR